MSKITAQILRDPARPNWPGVLVMLSIEDGHPPNAEDSLREAERIKNLFESGSAECRGDKK